MAAQVNPDIANLEPTSALYNLYTKLLNGMTSASQADKPDYIDNPPYLKNGDNSFQTDSFGDKIVDAAEIERQIAEYSGIMTQNAAYMFAHAIDSVYNRGSGSGGSGGVFVSRNGDSMNGLLSANKGFEAGVDGTKIFETVKESGVSWAIVRGNLRVMDDCDVQGKLSVSADGISINGAQTLYHDTTDNIIVLVGNGIKLDGNVEVAGEYTQGDFKIGSTGAYWDNNVYYHAGNSNLSTVDWEMKDAKVAGDLTVDGAIQFKGKLTALHGFELGDNNTKLLYSDTNCVSLDTDFDIRNNHGIKFDGVDVLNVRDESHDIIALSAPGRTLNLGDGSNGTATTKISLQADIYDYSNTYKLISKEGAGHFPQGLKAAPLGSATTVLETLSNAGDDGVVFSKKIWFGSGSGPYISQYSEDGSPKDDCIAINIPYTHGETGSETTDYPILTLHYEPTTNPFIDASEAIITLNFDTDGDTIGFLKPVELPYLLIKKSGQYSTALLENQLFFDKGKYLESIDSAIRWVGNAVFNGDLTSQVFTSGFAGVGWGIVNETAYGGYRATFDNLTIRKKLRVYEYEVQKISVSNGSLWVSDSCSGDEVIALN